MNARLKTLLLWAIILLVAVVLYQLLSGDASTKQSLTYTQFLEHAEHGDVLEVELEGHNAGYTIQGKLRAAEAGRGSDSFDTDAPLDDNLIPLLRANNVNIKVKKPKESALWVSLLSWLPMIAVIAIWVFLMRQMQAGGNKAMSFGKSKARLQSSQGKKVTFKDVAGVDEAKEELQEIIEFLKDPQKFQKLGGKIPKGVLLMGAPGTGKTLLARAISGEASVPFFSISGSDFVEMFVGVGASRVRDLFEQGKKNAPCIVFIDEIDAVGRHRGAGLGGGHDEREQTLNQLLVEMDGFETNEGVILIAATNRPDVLDPALLRPGRFDRRVVVAPPDIKGREGILKVHTVKIPLDPDVNILVLARGTPGFTGADLASLVNEAALNAARYSQKTVTMADFETAKDKVLMGAERKSMILSEDERRSTAYHEAGHALVAALLPDTDPLHQVSIIPRGMALGVTQQIPIDDRHNYTREYLDSQICVLMGGRAAEELFLDQLTTGAGNDIERATEMARKMVCEWGMSKEMGPLTFGKKEEQIFLGREIAQHMDYSEATAVLIDKEVHQIATGANQRARNLLEERRDTLKKIAKTLLEREVLDGDEIDMLIRGEDLPARPPARTPPPASEPATDSSTAEDRPQPPFRKPLEQPS
ncbi:MAG: ATP-dependent zinc metalloprotease FtsH [Acidobacteria bacterium]|nr:ATP-dependent zinc metalloprotease FtsH [Acidobacteriota bacterium]